MYNGPAGHRFYNMICDEYKNCPIHVMTVQLAVPLEQRVVSGTTYGVAGPLMDRFSYYYNFKPILYIDNN